MKKRWGKYNRSLKKFDFRTKRIQGVRRTIRTKSTSPSNSRILPGKRTTYLLQMICIGAFVLSGCSTAESVVVPEASPIVEEVTEMENLPVRTKSVTGYYASWMKGAWLEMDLSVYDRMVFFSTTSASDGSLLERNGWPHAWVSWLARADSLDIPVVPSLALLDADSIRTLFSSMESIERLIASSLELIEESKGQGLHLDIEYFEVASDTVRSFFQHFTDSLAQTVELDWPSAHLSMFVPAFDYGGLYDLEKVHPRYDELIVQGYDLHWQTGPRAGPVSPISGWGDDNWQRVLDRYLDAGVSPDRISMSVPYFGYEWPVETAYPGSPTRGDGLIVTFGSVDPLVLPQYQISAQDRIRDYGSLRDDESGSPYYTFEDSTGVWQGWYEDDVSLRHKYQFVLDRGLGGVATFPIGYDQGQLDPLLLDAFGYPHRHKR